MLYRTRFENEIESLREHEDTPPSPGAKTYHLSIDLNEHLAGKKIGVHVPAAAALAEKPDVIVYFHGFVGGKPCYEDGKAFEARGMEYYWTNDRFKTMRSELDASGRKAMLIAPTLDPRVGATGTGTKQYGDLHEPNAFDGFIRKVCDDLVARRAIRPSVKLGNIVLAAHSGGGFPMSGILNATNKLGAKVRACWGFECLYYPADTWLNWLNTRKLLMFRHFRQKGVMNGPTDVLATARHKNFVDTTTNVAGAHCGLVRDFWSAAISHMPTEPGTDDKQY